MVAALSFLNTTPLPLVLCSRVSISSPKDVAISAVCQRDQMQQLSDWEGFIVTVIKVATRSRREIHLGGGIRSPENILFGVKRTRLKSKQKQTVFVDVGRYREEAYRRAPSDESYWSDLSVLCRALCSHLLYADINNEQKFASTQCTIIKVWYSLSFFKHSNVRLHVKGHSSRDLLGYDRISGTFLSLTFRLLKSPACSTDTCCAAHKYVSGGRLWPHLTGEDLAWRLSVMTITIVTTWTEYLRSDQNLQMQSFAFTMTWDDKYVCCLHGARS